MNDYTVTRNDAFCYTVGTIIGYERYLLLPIGLLWVLTILSELKKTIYAKNSQTYTTQNDFIEKRQQDYYTAVSDSEGSLIKSNINMAETEIEGNQTYNARNNGKDKLKGLSC